MPQRRAFITGISGQDGSYLAELLLEKDYRVYGMVRRRSEFPPRIRYLVNRLEIVTGDLLDQGGLESCLRLIRPDEVYNFAAQSDVAHSFSAPVSTGDVTGLGALRLFEAVRLYHPHVKIYQASSSEMYGNPAHTPQDEQTPFHPVSPYGAAKLFAHTCALLYRKSYGIFIACGIAFNHESERRGEVFVSRKITQAVARVKAGEQQILRLGNLEAKRDWSHAEDIVRGAWLMLQQNQPADYVLASGQTHSVQEFAELAFNLAGLNSSNHILTDLALYRPADIIELCGNAQKARQQLGWEPQVSFEELVRRMVEHDCQEVAEAVHRDSQPVA